MRSTIRIPPLIAILLGPAPGPPAAQRQDGAPAAAAAEAPDAYLRGYIEAWLLYAHAIAPDRVVVAVHDGAVTLSGDVDSPEQIDRIIATVASFRGVTRVINRLEVAAEGTLAGKGPLARRPTAPAARWKTWLRWLQPPPGRRTVRFPRGDLFMPPLADQKQPRFHTTYQRYRLNFGEFDIASVGFGETFGLARWPREREGDGWQAGISGAVFALFNLDASSRDLLNADYIVGFPISYRSDRWSGRLRLYHQSSHLGDEFLLEPQPGPPVTRINLSYEALELLGSHESRGLRLYGGGTRIVSSDTSLGRDRAHAGIEYRGARPRWRTARVIAGFDVQAWDETGWDRDWSLKAGFLFRSPYGEGRSLQVLLEYYEGHAPHGQFFSREVEYFGVGIAYPF
ncbi:MAG: DUF1207 domain-containing protein [Acidobacteria bacterium]|nr:DUF1207 domain-containing protein [Acidobacteriota bacterium]